jgi:hypothetical protein
MKNQERTLKKPAENISELIFTHSKSSKQAAKEVRTPIGNVHREDLNL